MTGVVLDGVGSYIPTHVVKNEEFLNAEFYTEAGEPFPDENDDYQKV